MNDTFITPDKNDSFALLRGTDLQDLLIEIENYLLKYRDKLNLPSDVTFGVEIEYEGIFKKLTDKFVENKLNCWISSSDGSLNSGGEVISPIMTDEIKYWQELKTICDFLSARKANTSNNAGGHIHIGTCVLGKDAEAWKHFLKLYTAYESVLFRFVYGDKINGRRGILRYAAPSADNIYKKIKKIDEAESLIDIGSCLAEYGKYRALNFLNVNYYNPQSKYGKNTLEFRSPNATTNAVIWQNNINAFTKMMIASRNKIMNIDFLDYKLKNEYIPFKGNEYLYNEINLKNVLEFVDLVFDNNLDKIYFLRQYLKSFQDNYGLSIVVKAKRFVK